MKQLNKEILDTLQASANGFHDYLVENINDTYEKDIAVVCPPGSVPAGIMCGKNQYFY